MSLAYRADIDGLRAVAVVPVVLYHADVPGFPGGFVGVDVFFVISGYLITAIIAREIAEGRFSIVAFYERRARRILPALFAVLAACHVAGWALLFPYDYEQMSAATLSTLFFVSNLHYVFLVGNYFAPAAEFAPLLHTWSLAIEEQFYIVFPILLLLTRGARARARLALPGAIMAVSFGAVFATRELSATAAFYATPGRVWEMGLGAALLIWAGRDGPTMAGRLLSAPPVVFIGLISYSLYLWHWPILAFLRHWEGTTVLPPAMATMAVLASFAAATLSWRYVERPFRRADAVGRRMIFTLSAAGAAALTAVSLALFVADGAPGRVAPQTLTLLGGNRDADPGRRACVRADPSGPLCRFGADGGADGGGADFLLWGDSHAEAAIPALHAAGVAAGGVGEAAVKNACPPLLGVRRADMPPSHGCDAHNAAVLAGLRARDDVRLVVLHARWASAALGARAPGEGGSPPLLTDDAQPAPSPAANAAVFERGMRATVAAIRATGREVVVLDGGPAFGWSVPRMPATAARWGRPPPDGPDRAAVDARNAAPDALFAALAADDPGVRVVSVRDLLCDPACRLTTDAGRPLYFDDDHVSVHAAEAIIGPALARRIWGTAP